MVALPLLLVASPAQAQRYWFGVPAFKNALADASIDYFDVLVTGSGRAGGGIAVLVKGPGSYYVKYRAAERGPLPWHRGTNNVRKSHGRREFNWADKFVLTTWAYEFKICKARKYRKDPCGQSLVIRAGGGTAIGG